MTQILDLILSNLAKLKYQHKKRGSKYYVILQNGVVQLSSKDKITEGDVLVTYVSEEDGKVYHRLIEEFHDGRFQLLDDSKEGK